MKNTWINACQKSPIANLGWYEDNIEIENIEQQKSLIANLGWYEENPVPSLELIEVCNLPKDSLIF